VELGSNAARFVLARIKRAEGFQVLDEERVQTRLGGGEPGTLPRDAVEETVDAVDRFLQRVRNGQNPRVVAVATSAVRDAASRDRILGALRRRAGVEVRILTGREEARLGALAALQSLPVRHGLIVDLGGASLQLTRVRDRAIVSSASLPLGAVRTTRRFLRHDPARPEELRTLRGAARALLGPALPAADRGEAMVGLGGTVRALASIHLRSGRRGREERQGLRLRQSHVTAIRERLEPLSEGKRRKVRGLQRERADIIVAGAVVLEEAMLLGGYLNLVVCTRGVRDGILLSETFHRGVTR
jgi:exopolyphosphatase / guanosine-5'-triphosphate,3'-diphosphate pyrophosphatase